MGAGGRPAGLLAIGLLLLWQGVSVYADGLDGDIEVEAIRLDVEARAMLAEASPDRSHISLFVAEEIDELDLQSISIRIDDGQTHHYIYSHREAHALNSRALHHLASLSLPAGTHRLRATLIGQKRTEKAHQARYTDEIDTAFNLQEGARQLAIRWSRTSHLGLLHKHELDLAELPKVALWQRSAQFWQASGQPLAAQSDLAFEGSLQGSARQAAAEPTAASLANYNLAMVALADGDASSLTEFALQAHSQEQAAMLRDRANLVLGYYHLERGHSKTAASHFSLVRRHSPYANRALIGLGWAKLNPVEGGADGDPYRGTAGEDYLWADSPDFIAWARRRTPFRNAWSLVSEEKSRDLIDAMRPWMELVAGDPHDPAVQEAMLVVPYALLHLGAPEQALQRYQRAERQLQTVTEEALVALQEVQSGAMASRLKSSFSQVDNGWGQWLGGVDPRGDNAYILRLLEDDAVLAALEKLRRVIGIETLLSRRKAELNSAFSDSRSAAMVAKIDNVLSRVEQRFLAQATLVEAQASAHLQLALHRTEAYLAETHFALARLAERRFEKLSEVSL